MNIEMSKMAVKVAFEVLQNATDRLWGFQKEIAPFAGSGSVGVACLQLNRRFVGFDLSKKYCDLVITSELSKYTLKLES